MRRLIVALGLAGVLSAGLVGTAAAESPKTCEEAYKQGWTLTKEQTAACQSSSNNKHEEPVSVTNPGGQLPPGQQP